MNESTCQLLNERLLASAPWEDSLTAPLEDCGFIEVKSDWKLLQDLSRQCSFSEFFPHFFEDFLKFLSGSFDPNIALRNFSRFADCIDDKNHFYSQLAFSPDFHQKLITLFSGSQVLTDTLLQNPSLVDWLGLPETLEESKSRDGLMRDYYDLAGKDYNTEKTPSLLRRFKKREYIRVGLRDLLGTVSFEETVGDISNIADVALQAAYEFAEETLQKKYGVPYYEDADGKRHEAEFTVLGMGKLGGRELNYSSDIDIICIYSSSKGETVPEPGKEGQQVRISNHEYFTKLAQLLTKTLHEITPEGAVFRVDLDLRPEGKSGEIANSLASCEIYYQSWGRTWERQALIKARVSAGSEALGNEFYKLVEPFVYRRSLDFSAIKEIKSMKLKINDSLKARHKGQANIKLGFGGIREIEFIVQAYQLIFGGRNISLREPNTLRVLKRLRSREFINADDYSKLKDAYIFLRNLENRVQISFGLQTHDLPKGESRLRSLAKKMRIEGEPEQLSARLMEQFNFHTEFVGKMFAELFADEEDQSAAENASREWTQDVERNSALSEEHLKRLGFAEPPRTLIFLKSLREGKEFSHPSEKSLQVFDAVYPRLMESCLKSPNPNSALENLVKFMESSGARESYMSLFESNEKLLELILILLGGSNLLAEILIKQPGLVDVVMDMEAIYRFKSPERICEDLEKQLHFLQDLDAKKIALRRFKQAEELRVGLRYLIGEVDIMSTMEDLSNLADIFLQSICGLAFEEAKRKTGESGPDNFAIVTLGKHGGRELNFGSDLDVIFVYDHLSNASTQVIAELSEYYSSVSQLIFKLSSEMTPAGIAYKMDADLRPEGGGGSLVLSLDGYKEYFNSRARIWERQAMTRARFVAGNPDLGNKFLAVAQQFTYGQRLEYGDLIEISRLRERMVVELAQEAKKGKNVKLGLGGLADIEFIVQILQLKHGGKYPQLCHTNTFEAVSKFAQCGLLEYEVSEQVRKCFLFLRNLECALRLWNPNSKNYLPKDEFSLAILARLLRYSGEDDAQLSARLLEDYEDRTQSVRAFYNKMLDNLLRSSI
ncbi:MAG: bifunctional [glutamate--ammonia ligase]-adenylyl-L-tyrosine phosphorylase/[glutamate--ammonia-ligase] adenylyltransferase [Candidatus Nitrohelix vancouverensis]|uniref:Bifunctional [glutamate--ammonia ligase]-adenylyl-L-tyrosine phosphorylase/[glutamate--ammonia-ligase] adenylyltransferase n=1 Tax=Candidatus Nitrohelix vancouverensis TaxID=2705534 RepID=A0A7T0G267_9BACT|nr:MAG: bifunctional [glutamate--ammonia ligase]-adenylyl-L-tyrosine phosphorylase/[glutamate--ammonia-ligase] adenylyltransferase [Candidatus Nitrohelix vancouverensis]